MPSVCSPSLARLSSVLVALSLAMAFGAGCSSSGASPCQERNHCVDDNGDYSCEDGYEWEDPDDLDNYNCVEIDDNGDGDGDGDGDGNGDGDGDGDSNCGNGALDSGEQCDGFDLGGATCVSQGFGGGTLGCDGDCRYDTGSCLDPCMPECNGRECGADGCGGTCGVCSSFSDVCLEGACTEGPCPSELEDCDGECADVLGNPNHCGGCGFLCPSYPGATRLCEAGTCDWVCPGAGSGIDFANDPDNCGGCGVSCPQPLEGERTCSEGICADLCPMGKVVCDISGETYCAELDDDAFNCGTCGNVCPVAEGGERQCVQGNCAGPCPDGFDTCSVQDVDVCVDFDTDEQNCGSCGNVCDPAPAGGFSQCVNGQCDVGCSDSAETDCNGVCKNLTNDEAACGSCTNTCDPAPVGGHSQCVNSQCDVGCDDSAESACNGVCQNLNDDYDNCGACGFSCSDFETQASSNGFGAAVCSGGVCAAKAPFAYTSQGSCAGLCDSYGLGCVEPGATDWWADSCSSAEAVCDMQDVDTSASACVTYTVDFSSSCKAITIGCSDFPPSTYQYEQPDGLIVVHGFDRTWCTCGATGGGGPEPDPEPNPEPNPEPDLPPGCPGPDDCGGTYTECGCHPSDPCNWSGDGFCDEMNCQTNFGFFFDDGTDCQ